MHEVHLKKSTLYSIYLFAPIKGSNSLEFIIVSLFAFDFSLPSTLL